MVATRKRLVLLNNLAARVQVISVLPHLDHIEMLQRVLSHQPPGPDRVALERVASFADFAAQNLDLSKKVLGTVGQPIRVKSVLLRGRRTPLDTFAVVAAVSISMMFVCALLAAGALALEREEHALARLVRGLVSREVLLADKGLLAAACAWSSRSRCSPA